MTADSLPTEVDCPWFDTTWLIDHPEFPLAASIADGTNTKEETHSD